MTEHTTMTDAEIAEALARCEKATPGEWKQKFQGGTSVVLSNIEPRRNGASTAYGFRAEEGYSIALPFLDEWGDARPDFVNLSHDDAAFIAHARTDLPRALRDLAQARERIAELERMLAEASAEWQPIATAPRNGTLILAWKETWDWPKIVRWEKSRFPHVSEFEWREPTGELGYIPEAFTDWMPLPRIYRLFNRARTEEK